MWKTLRALKAELGEALALDLKTRHLDADPKMNGKFVKPYLVLISLVQSCLESGAHAARIEVSPRAALRHPNFPGVEAG